MSIHHTRNEQRPERIRSPEPRIYMPAMPPLALIDALGHGIRVARFRFRRYRLDRRARAARLRRNPA